MNTIPTIIIDDDKASVETLSLYLTRCFPQVSVVASAHDVGPGIMEIEAHRPQLVFLDIEMPSGTGFDLLEKLKYRDFELVFVTAHNQFAMNAFRFGALDFLLKPLNVQHLDEAMARVLDRSRRQLSLDVLLDHIGGLQQAKKIAIPVVGGFEVVLLEDIIYLKGERNYTRIFLKNDHKIVSSRTLKKYQDLLEPSAFFRVHQSFLINLDQIKSYSTQQGSTVMLAEGSSIPVSRSYKDALVAIFKNMMPDK
jgi:two-component system LytT family response regulator